MEYRVFVKTMVDSYLHHMNKKAVFFKHYDTFEIRMEELLSGLEHGKEIEFFVHEYTENHIRGAYEPFLGWVKEFYHRFYEEKYTPEQFIQDCNVYSLHQSIFTEYIRNGACLRTEELMVEECEYEQFRMVESLYSIYKKVAEEHKIMLVVLKLHLTTYSSLNFIRYILSRENNIHFIFSYNDMFYVAEYIKDQWDELIHLATKERMLLEWGKIENSKSGISRENFDIKHCDLQEYIKMATDMRYMLCYKDMIHYLRPLYEYTNRTGTKYKRDDVLELSRLYAMAEYGDDNTSRALFVCEKILPTLKDNEHQMLYEYNYLSAACHLIQEETDLMKKFVDEAKLHARALGDARLEYNAEIVETIGGFGSLKVIFKCNYKNHVNEEMIEKAKRFKNYNFLAYMHIFGYENDEQAVRDIATGKRVPTHFEEGITIAKRIGNDNLQRQAYMKNIILFSAYGYHEYVQRMYEKRIAISQNLENLRIAHMYSGMGYNAIVLGNYKLADRNFRDSLDMLIECRKSEDISDTLYNMALNFLLVDMNEQAAACIDKVFEITELLGVQGIRICSTTKLLGIRGIVNYKLEQYYNCYYCLNKITPRLSHALYGCDLDKKQWEEDLAMYYLLSGLMYAKEEKFDQAEEQFELAKNYVESMTGAQFYLKAEYALLVGQYYRQRGDEERCQKELLEAYEYYLDKEYDFKAQQLMAAMSNRPFKTELEELEKPIPFDKIDAIARLEGAQLNIKERERDLSFLTVFQDLVSRSNIDEDKLHAEVIGLLQNSYNLENIVSITKENGRFIQFHQVGDVHFSVQNIKDTVEYFSSHQKELLISRVDKDFFSPEYKGLIDGFGIDNVVTYVGIPIIRNDKVRRVFIATINIHRIYSRNQRLLTAENMLMMRTAIDQLYEAKKRIRNARTIEDMNSRLERAAVTDCLTGIQNRQGFENQIRYQKDNEGIVLYMDLDNFKYYNDTFGHHIGDCILVEFAIILEQVTEDWGMPFRYGGDEFILVYPERDENFGMDIAIEIKELVHTQLMEHIQRKLPEKTVITPEHRINCSFGIACYEGTSTGEMETTLKHADEALYYVKRRGKGGCCCWSDLEER